MNSADVFNDPKYIELKSQTFYADTLDDLIDDNNLRLFYSIPVAVEGVTVRDYYVKPLQLSDGSTVPVHIEITQEGQYYVGRVKGIHSEVSSKGYLAEILTLQGLKSTTNILSDGLISVLDNAWGSVSASDIMTGITDIYDDKVGFMADEKLLKAYEDFLLMHNPEIFEAEPYYASYFKGTSNPTLFEVANAPLNIRRVAFATGLHNQYVLSLSATNSTYQTLDVEKIKEYLQSWYNINVSDILRYKHCDISFKSVSSAIVEGHYYFNTDKMYILLYNLEDNKVNSYPMPTTSEFRYVNFTTYGQAVLYEFDITYTDNYKKEIQTVAPAGSSIIAANTTFRRSIYGYGQNRTILTTAHSLYPYEDPILYSRGVDDRINLDMYVENVAYGQFERYTENRISYSDLPQPKTGYVIVPPPEPIIDPENPTPQDSILYPTPTGPQPIITVPPERFKLFFPAIIIPPVPPIIVPVDTTIPAPLKDDGAKFGGNYYHCQPENIDALNWVLWDRNVLDKLLTTFKNNPMDGIISLHRLYVIPKQSVNESTDDYPIMMGEVDCRYELASITAPERVQGYGVAPVIIQPKQVVNMGQVQVPRVYMDSRDYEPYTSVQLLLPFIGIVDITPSDIVGYDCMIKYLVDIYTGDCVAFVYRVEANSQGTTNNILIGQYNGNCAQQTPITANDTSKQLIGAVSSMISIATGNVIGGIMSAANLQNIIQITGNMSGNVGGLGYKEPFLIIRRPIPYDATYQPDLIGYPANISGTLAGIPSGFVRVKEAHVDTIACTQSEKDEILRLLKTGILI